LGGRDLARRNKSVRLVWAVGTEKPVKLIPEPVRPVWRQQSNQFGFRARDKAQFRSFRRGPDVWHGEFAGG
jgi:hypothetical protein